MSKALVKDILRSINRTKTRFLSIAAIVALGISVFAGIKATAPNLKDTAEQYFNQNNLMDIHVLSTIGLTDIDMYQISRVTGVEAVMPAKFADALLEVDGKSIVDIEGAPFCTRAMSINTQFLEQHARGVDDAAYINRFDLLEGSMPVNDNECVIDSSHMTSTHTFKVGDKLTLRGDGENLESKLKVTEFTVVGIVRTPLYISVERGSTLIGSGKLGNFIYVPMEAFATDYYTDAYLRVAGAEMYKAFSPAYNTHVRPVIEAVNAIAQGRLTARAIALSAELTPKVQEGKAQLAQKEAEAEQKLAEARELVEQVKYYAEHGEQELAEKKAEYENSLSAAQRELFSGQSQYNRGLAEYNAKLAEYNAARAEADKYPNARKDYNEAVAKLQKADEDIKAAEKRVENLKNAVSITETALVSADEDAYNKFIFDLKAAGIDTSFIEALGVGATGAIPEVVRQYMLATGLPTIKTELTKYENEVKLAKQQYEVGEYMLHEAEKDIKKLDELDRAYAQLKDAEAKLQSGQSDISMGELTLSMRQMELKYELEKAQAMLAEAKAKADTVDEEYAKREAEVMAQLQAAKYDLAAAESLLNNLDKAQWLVNGRDALPGHVEYDQSADNMKAFSRVFPVFFFLIAAVVSLTTMTRMVEEERVQLGTLKALGYTAGSIAAKYLIYAALASVIGSAVGLAIGFVVYPKAIFDAYSIMFTTPPIILRFHPLYAVVGTLIVTGAVAAATLFACRNELVTCPAQLMRPKAPKPGKRVFLEKIEFVWRRMSFSSKVTARNLLRNKRRFIMTVIGISGCTALLLTGLGIEDSISAISKKQFGADGIAMYDAQIVLRDAGDGTTREQTLAGIRADTGIQDAMLTFIRSLDSGSERVSDFTLGTSILVPESNQKLSDFVKLTNRRSGEVYTLGDDGVLITEKFADKTKTAVGDEIFMTLTDDSRVTVKVAGIVENYAFHYIYMSPALYQQTFGETPAYNFVTAKLTDTVKNMDEARRNAEKSRMASDLMKRDDVSVVVYTSQSVETFDNIIEGLDMLVTIFVVAAGALAFLVLYNLSNININERVRELATIKVLGFYDREVSSYIYRESVFLTLLGTAIGVALGLPLHRFVIGVAEVNIVMFGREIAPLSMVIAAVTTLVFAVIVNLLMHRKLKKINMVESLKSVE